jgi:hypothetical protein
MGPGRRGLFYRPPTEWQETVLIQIGSSVNPATLRSQYNAC